MQAVQQRVGVTQQFLSSLKGMKMLGLTRESRDSIQGLREAELLDDLLLCLFDAQVMRVACYRQSSPLLATPCLLGTQVDLLQMLPQSSRHYRYYQS